ncbi:hypothetical protein QTV49_001803 [Vibrio vulnificus]|nr:hypothetical protein [Vibrio vulnificus]
MKNFLKVALLAPIIAMAGCSSAPVETKDKIEFEPKKVKFLLEVDSENEKQRVLFEQVVQYIPQFGVYPYHYSQLDESTSAIAYDYEGGIHSLDDPKSCVKAKEPSSACNISTFKLQEGLEINLLFFGSNHLRYNYNLSEVLSDKEYDAEGTQSDNAGFFPPISTSGGWGSVVLKDSGVLAEAYIRSNIGENGQDYTRKITFSYKVLEE